MLIFFFFSSFVYFKRLFRKIIRSNRYVSQTTFFLKILLLCVWIRTIFYSWSSIGLIISKKIRLSIYIYLNEKFFQPHSLTTSAFWILTSRRLSWPIIWRQFYICLVLNFVLIRGVKFDLISLVFKFIWFLIF